MPANLEIKAKIKDTRTAESAADSVPARYGGEMYQVDTYFNVPEGRLKLRQIKDSHAELIYYKRKEDSISRLSRFEVYTAKEPAVLMKILKNAYGIRGVVRKRRILYFFGDTRIHIDSVKGLGSFVEFEVPFRSKYNALKTLKQLTAVFKIRKGNYIKKSYLDLLTAGREAPNRLQ